MATRKATKPPPGPTTLEQQYDEAVAQQLELLSRTAETVQDEIARARASQRVWSLQALLLQAEAKISEAAKAGKCATDAGMLAMRLSRDDLPDRVAKLEKLVKDSRTTGSRVRELAVDRRKKK